MNTADVNASAASDSDLSLARRAIADTLARLSAAWRDRRYDDLRECFDEHVAMALPGFSGRVEGRDPLVESYREFMERATLTRYEERPPVIDVFGDTAIATCRWEMRWLADGAENDAAGHDLFVLVRTNAPERDGWRAVWRTMTFDA